MANELGKEAVDLLFLTMDRDQIATIVSQTLKDIAAKKDKNTIGAVNLALTNKVMGGYDKAVHIAQRGGVDQEALTAEIAGRIEIKKLDAQRQTSVLGATSDARLKEISAMGAEKRTTLELQDRLAHPEKYVALSDAAKEFGNKEIASLESHLAAVKSGSQDLLPLQDDPIRGEGWETKVKRLESLGEPFKYKVPELQASRTLLQTAAVGGTQATLAAEFKDGLSDSLKNTITQTAAQTGHVQEAASESVKAAKQAMLMETAMLEATQKAGMALTPEGQLVNKGVFSKMLGSVFGDRPQASAMLSAIRAKGGTPDPGALAKAMEMAKGSRLAKAGVGGVLAAVLLPMLLSRGKGDEQQDIPLPLKIQLMQTMASQQNQSALIQSLVGSRAAGAEKDQASAELLRLKAMMMMPQSGGGIL